ncbi:tRNA ligase class II core domain protein [Cooperia oncophora]
MVRTHRRRPSNCAEDEENMQKTPSKGFYGLPYVSESGRPDWSLMQRMAVGHCQRLNRDEGFLFFDPAAPGSPYWGSRTTHAYNVLVKLIKSEYSKHGFCEAVTPNMYSDSLWEPHGRWQHFSQEISRIAMTRGDMLTASCSGHCLFYGHTTPSFTELPIRHSDFGVVHRSNGVSNPLRQPYDSIDFLSFFYGKVMKFNIEAELSTRSHDCCLGDLWETTEKVLKDEFQKRGRSTGIREGAAPFYGPRLDLTFREPNGRYHIYGSIQLDFELPERFDLGYIGEDGKRHRPVLIHRAIVPPAETILAIIATECGECWPFWLSLHQVNVIPVCAVSVPYARKVAKEFTDANYEANRRYTQLEEVLCGFRKRVEEEYAAARSSVIEAFWRLCGQSDSRFP